MPSPIKPKPKSSRLARITEKPVWRRKPNPRNKSISTNDVAKQTTPPPTFVPNYTPNPQAHSNEPSHKPHHNNQPSTFTPENTPSSHSCDSYEEHDQPQNKNLNLIHNTSHLIQPTNAPSKTLTTLVISPSSISLSSSTHDYPNLQMYPPSRVSPPPPTNSHVAPMLHVQTSIPDNNHTPPSSPF